MSTTVGEDPLSLQSATRTFVADAITPISAYLALAQPGRSCLLESVEGSDRMSRFSFIGLDYLEAASFDDDPNMLGRIRALIGKYHLDTNDLPFPGGAVCVFTYDAARVLERIGPTSEWDVPVETLNLSVRSFNCLKRAGISKVSELLDMTEDEIFKMRNFGKKSLDEIKQVLEERGLSLRQT